MTEEKTSVTESEVLGRLDPRIWYVSALPVQSGLVSPIQGFSRERLELRWVFNTMIRLPATYFELAGPVDMARGMRACGMLGWRHLPVRIDRLIRMRIGPHAPLLVVFSADKEVARFISIWQTHQQIKPLHVSTTGVTGSVRAGSLDAEQLRKHIVELPGKIGAELGELVKLWRVPVKKLSAFPFRGHLTLTPNQMSLFANGVESKEFLPHWHGESEQDYSEAIYQTTQAVLALHDETDAPTGIRLAPPRPSLWLVAPSFLPDLRPRLMQRMTERADQLAISDLAKRIERQRDFKVNENPGETRRREASTQARALLETRHAELELFALAIGWAAAGTMAAVWRMRPSVNRITGKVRQFAENIRAEASTEPPKVRALFDEVQLSLSQCLDHRAVALIENTEWGVKVVSDAPVEWLPIGDLPLGLAKDFSRITSTPADLLLRQLETHEWLRIAVSDFSEILIVSAFKEGGGEDWIAGAIEALPLMRVKLRVVRVSSESELIEALNSYDGPLMIFDGHGAHSPTGRGHLKVGVDEVEIGRLDGRVRMPPIIMLSACDTHAAARSTQTVANAMLSLGARTVLATNLPVRYKYAAIMVIRLILGIEHYLPIAALKLGRVLRWSEFIGRMLRQQFLLEVLDNFRVCGSLDQELFQVILDKVSHLADRSLETALVLLEQELFQRGIADPAELRTIVQDLVPVTDVIRYVQLGNPETITIGSIEDLSEDMQGTKEDQATLAPKWRFGKVRPTKTLDTMEMTGQVGYGPWPEAPGKPNQ